MYCTKLVFSTPSTLSDKLHRMYVCNSVYSPPNFLICDKTEANKVQTLRIKKVTKRTANETKIMLTPEVRKKVQFATQI